MGGCSSVEKALTSARGVLLGFFESTSVLDWRKGAAGAARSAGEAPSASRARWLGVAFPNWGTRKRSSDEP